MANAKFSRPTENKSKFYLEAVKRSTPNKQYWSNPPPGWKGTRIQWQAHEKAEKERIKALKEGKNMENTEKFKTMKDMKLHVSEHEIKAARNLQLK